MFSVFNSLIVFPFNHFFLARWKGFWFFFNLIYEKVTAKFLAHSLMQFSISQSIVCGCCVGYDAVISKRNCFVYRNLSSRNFTLLSIMMRT